MSMPVASSFTIVVSELFGVVFKTFFWWYSDGVARLFDWTRTRLAFRWRSLAFRFWASHLFQPMYGQSDVAGRLISVVMRFVILVWRTLVLFGSLFVHALALFAWFFLPAFVVAMTVLNVLASVGLIHLM